jgi:hypothetical protein
MKFLQMSTFWLSNALLQLEFIRIVAPKVAGSSPVGHPPLGAMVLATIVVVVVAGPAQLSRKHHKQEEVDPMSLRCLRLPLV